MNTDTTTSVARLPATGAGLAARLRAALTALGDRVHEAGDARARAAGWAITRTPGRLGLDGRAYHDPRFASRQPEPLRGRPR